MMMGGPLRAGVARTSTSEARRGASSELGERAAAVVVRERAAARVALARHGEDLRHLQRTRARRQAGTRSGVTRARGARRTRALRRTG